MVFLVGGANSASGAYEIDNSCRFNNGDSPKLSFDLSSPNVDKFTVSMWVKLGDLSGNMGLWTLGKALTGETGDYTTIDVKIGSNGRLAVDAYDGVNDANVAAYNTAATGPIYRDPTAWYHFVFAFDTGDGTAGNRFKWYVNGSNQTANLATTTTPSQNADLFHASSSSFDVGYDRGNNAYHDGYISEVYYCDGYQYAASDFGETNDNGVWIPKKFTGSYGTNGIRLQFKETGTSANSSGIGADTGSEGNHMTVSNLAATDITTDTPTNNFCTLNSIAPDTTGSQDHSFSEGNTLVRSSSASWFNAFGTIGIPASGKWYYEFKTTGSGTIDQNIGFVKGNFHRGSGGGTDQVDCYSLYAASNGNGLLYTDSTSDVDKGTDWCWTHDDIMMVAIDCSSRNIWYGKNGTWLGSGDPANDSNEAQTVSAEDLAYGLLPAFSGYHTASYHYVNFGNPAYANSSSQADDAGYGDFEYDPPTGFYSLCTKNLAEYG
jgi:hypothetical protein